MTAIELIIQITSSKVDSLFRTARSLPADRLDWKPSPESRSVIDQLQEVATALSKFEDSWIKRKIEFSDDQFASWQEERSKLKTLDELEARTRKETADFLGYLKTVDPAELSDPVEMPFPGDFNLADIVTYHYWNMSYHEGQIYYIGTLERVRE